MSANAALKSSERATKERFERREKSKFEKAGFGHTETFSALLGDGFGLRLTEHIRARIEKMRPDYVLARLGLRHLVPADIAVIGLTAVFNFAARYDLESEAMLNQPKMRRQRFNRKKGGGAFDGPDDYLEVKQRVEIGEALQDQIWAAELQETNKAAFKKIQRIQPGPRRSKKARSFGYRKRKWSEKQKYKAGSWFLDCCQESLPDAFEVAESGLVILRDDARKLIQRLRKLTMLANPVFLPCKSNLKPWTGLRDGGFWNEQTSLRTKFVRSHYGDTDDEIKRAFVEGTMTQHTDAVSALQNVPLRINEPVLNALKRHGDRLRKERKLKLPSTTLDQDIETASALSTSGFYVPLSCDSRGRIYGVPHFHFQREDHVRALFLFERGSVPDVDKGHEELSRLFLARHLVNCAGSEIAGAGKKSWVDCAQWANNRRDFIRTVAKARSDKWLEADEPFQFLAACIEYCAQDEPGYVARLPVSLDASSSGIQHLSAMTRDAVGARLSNLGRHSVYEPPADIYSVVKDRVNQLIQEREPELLSKIEIDRKAVKQPTMTFYYGATDSGRAKQIFKALFEENLKKEFPQWKENPPETEKQQILDARSRDMKISRRIGKYVCEAVREIFPKGFEVCDCLQQYTKALNERKAMLHLVSPSGFPWTNRYLVPKTKRVEILLSGVRRRRLNRTLADGHEDIIDEKRAKNGAAANFIHAMDAAHLVRTANACMAEGINDLVTVHDCFACPAPQGRKMLNIARDQFAKMYEEHDPLTELRDNVLKQLGPDADALLPKIAKGTFDIGEVRQSAYFQS